MKYSNQSFAQIWNFFLKNQIKLHYPDGSLVTRFYYELSDSFKQGATRNTLGNILCEALKYKTYVIGEN